MIERAKVLIIEDDLDIIEAMKVVLESKKYQVIYANDGKEGFEKAESEKPNLIILDVIMRHETEGFDVTQNLRRNERTKYIPILMITSITQKTGFPFSPETDGEFLPVDDFVEKPVQPYDLLNRVEKLLKLSKEKINIGGRKNIL
ncbi:MAG: response regulator [Elusimicrobia bacterium]|nr:response regulator [Elusimicrobiota bacterium]